MKKTIVLFVLLVAVMAGTAFGQTYRNGTTYKYWISMEDNLYRNLKIQTKTEWAIGLNYIEFVKASTAGDPNIVEVLGVFPKTDKNFKKGTKEWKVGDNKWKVGDKTETIKIKEDWKVGDKTDIQTIWKNGDNVTEYRIRTPKSGYWVVFAGGRNGKMQAAGSLA